MTPDACPSEAELTAFCLGDLAADRVETLAGHVEACAACERRLQALEAVGDDAVCALRDLNGAPPPADPHPRPGAHVGAYEILDELGRGGMGVVFKARHRALNRVVALKMILGGRFGSAEYRARFRAEAEAAARVSHPGIVQLYEAGEWDAGGRVPYLAFEFVDGVTLGRRAGDRPQPPREAAAWVEALARAADAAHRAGVVHRDLKPSNVLVAPDGRPKLCDFGVAKLTGAEGGTGTGLLVGTPEYMAPEQAAGARAVGPAADVYALGAILYTLLTGRPPFQAPDALGVLAQVRHDEPVPPRRLQPGVPRDLETVCLKCLNKEPARRYATALELADDLHRFLAGRPVVARPVGAAGRAVRWARRHPVPAALAAALAVVTAAGVGLVGWQWRDAVYHREEARDRARGEADARREAERLLAAARLDEALGQCERGRVGPGLHRLADALELADRVGDPDLGRAARLNLTAWAHGYTRERARLAHTHWVWAVAVSPDGTRALTGSRDGTARVWDVATGHPVGRALTHPEPVWAVAFSPDGRRALTACAAPDGRRGEARVWDVAAGEPRGDVVPVVGMPEAVAFRPDGRSFLVCGRDEVRLWASDGPRPLGPSLAHGEPSPPATAARYKAAAYSPDGTLVLTAGTDGTARLWDAATGEPRGPGPLRHAGPVTAVAFAPDGRLAATASADATVQLWRLPGGEPGPVLRHRGPVWRLAFSPDGKTLATGGGVEVADAGRKRVAGEARLWRADGSPLLPPLEHPSMVWSLAFTPSGRGLLTGCEDGAGRLFCAATGALLGAPMTASGTVSAVAVGPTGVGLLASATRTGGPAPYAAARLWQLPDPPAVLGPLAHDATVRALAFAPDGGLTTVSESGAVRDWDLAAVAVARTTQVAAPEPLEWAALAADRATLVVARRNPSGIGFWDVRAGRPGGADVPVTAPYAVAAAGDGRLVVVADREGSVRVLRVPDGTPVGPAVRPDAPPSCVAVTADGRVAFTGGRVARLWDVAGGTEVRSWPLADRPMIAAFAPDGRTLLVGSEGGAVELFETTTGRAVGPPRSHASPVTAVAFSPDGRLAATAGFRDAVRVWDVATGRGVGRPLGGPGVRALAFDAAGARLASGGPGGAFVWSLPAPAAGSAERVRGEVASRTSLDLPPALPAAP